jgi:hypothetical protein
MGRNLRTARVFLAQDRHGIVAAMCFITAGIYYEQDQPSVVDSWREGVELGISLRSALGRFCFREANLRDPKLTDWPSYEPRAAGPRASLKIFFFAFTFVPLMKPSCFMTLMPNLPAKLKSHCTLRLMDMDRSMSSADSY